MALFARSEVIEGDDGRFRLTKEAAIKHGKVKGQVVARANVEPLPEPSPPQETSLHSDNAPAVEPTAAGVESVPDAIPPAPEPAPDAIPPAPDAIPPAPDFGALPSMPSPAMSAPVAHLPGCHRCTAERPQVCPGCTKPVNPPLTPEESEGFAMLWLAFVATAATVASNTPAAKARGVPSIPYQEPTQDEITKAGPVVGLVVQRRLPAAAASVGDLAALAAITGQAIAARLDAAAAEVPQ